LEISHVSHCPRLLYKIYRPYMMLHLPIGERLAAARTPLPMAA
jgi:uncharacterized protein VirK/YbjX